MRIIFPSLSYCEAIDKAAIPTLIERRESLSEHHKLANLLPSMTSSQARRLRNEAFKYLSLSH